MLETLQVIWFILWALLWAVYFVLDGFDLGLGSLLLFPLQPLFQVFLS